MRLKTLLAAGASFGVALFSAGLVLDLTTAKPGGPTDGDAGDPTFALAPLSLGHPAAAAGLANRWLHLPWADDPGDRTEDAPADAVITEHHRIGAGETLALVLKRAGVAGAEADAAIRAFAKNYDPRRLRPGQKISVRFRTELPHPVSAADGDVADGDAAVVGAEPGRNRFLGFGFAPDFRQEILVNRRPDGGFNVDKEAKKLKHSLAGVTGRIESSLYLAAQEAGVPAGVLAELIRIYSWDVDFQRDIRAGDSFELLYEQIRDQSGRLVHSGAIQYAALTLSGERRALYRFAIAKDEFDYFDETGQSAKKALMRTPIDGARLTSGFGKRHHPILGYTKMHKGIDFAAPRGTPIYAAGDGVVSYAGRKGGYGNYIRIRHNGRYSTAYAHMKAFRRGVHGGSRVRQGQVIGYVGTTGRSTGPHLHYEILVDSRQVNPLRVKMPSGRKLAGEALKRFQLAKAALDQQFARHEAPTGKAGRLAQADQPE